jgi:hypothetical protein
MKEAEWTTFVLRSSTYTARRSKGWGADQQIDKTNKIPTSSSCGLPVKALRHEIRPGKRARWMVRKDIDTDAGNTGDLTRWDPELPAENINIC